MGAKEVSPVFSDGEDTRVPFVLLTRHFCKNTYRGHIGLGLTEKSMRVKSWSMSPWFLCFFKCAMLYFVLLCRNSSELNSDWQIADSRNDEKSKLHSLALMKRKKF